jgi:hypothetical protein
MDKMPRFWDWMLLALFLFALLWTIRTPSVNVWLVGTQQPDGTVIGGWVPKDIIVLVYKAATVALGAIAGLWLDRSAFPYGRPDRIVPDPDDSEPWPLGDSIAFTGACLRRALVVIGFVFAFGLAL